MAAGGVCDEGEAAGCRGGVAGGGGEGEGEGEGEEDLEAPLLYRANGGKGVGRHGGRGGGAGGGGGCPGHHGGPAEPGGGGGGPAQGQCGQGGKAQARGTSSLLAGFALVRASKFYCKLLVVWAIVAVAWEGSQVGLGATLV